MQHVLDLVVAVAIQQLGAIPLGPALLLEQFDKLLLILGHQAQDGDDLGHRSLADKHADIGASATRLADDGFFAGIDEAVLHLLGVLGAAIILPAAAILVQAHLVRPVFRLHRHVLVLIEQV